MIMTALLAEDTITLNQYDDIMKISIASSKIFRVFSKISKI